MEEALLNIDNSIAELENLDIEDLPDYLQNDFIRAHSLLCHISISLEFKEVDK